MAKTGSSEPRFFLKQWRKHRGYTQERLAEALGSSSGYIADLENGKRRYNQDHLESLAEALNCTPADLLIRDPSKDDAIWTLWETLAPTERAQAVNVIRAIKGTGTGG